MSEIVGRMAIEADFAKRLSRLSSKQRAELRDKLGDPPDPSRVTSSDWARWEQERRQEMAGMLLAIWMLAANQHLEELLGNSRAVGSQRSAMAKKGGDKPRSAGDVAGGIIAAGGTGAGISDVQQSAMVRQGMASTAKQAAEVARANIEAAKEIVDAAGKGWATTPPSKANVEEVLTQAIGPARDATTAATEVTKAAVGGTNGVRPVVEDRGYNLITRWRTEKDDRVCPVCRPLDGKVPDLWEPVLRTLVAPGGTRAISQIVANGGPPAHPNCRCYLTTQAEPAAKRVRR
jgi:hypothetical protein